MDYKEFQTEVLTRLTAIETKIDDYRTTKEQVNTALNKSTQNEKDILEIKEKIKWISRTIGAALIAGIIGILFIYFQMGIGIK